MPNKKCRGCGNKLLNSYQCPICGASPVVEYLESTMEGGFCEKCKEWKSLCNCGKIVIKPKSMRQWMDWTERLDDAGCIWQAVRSPNKNAATEQGALSSIKLDVIDAKNILGITVLDSNKSN